jgi:hypothetical protein
MPCFSDITVPHASKVSYMVSSFQTFRSKFCVYLFSPCMLHAPLTSSSLIYNCKNISWRVQFMDIFTCNLLQSPVTSSSLSPTTFCSTLCSQISCRNDIPKHCTAWQVIHCPGVKSPRLANSDFGFFVIINPKVKRSRSPYWNLIWKGHATQNTSAHGPQLLHCPTHLTPGHSCCTAPLT